VAALALAGCGNADSAPSGAAGGVAVTLTDAPSDDFAQVNLTLTGIELLGPQGAVPVWSGLESVDLLDLDDVSEPAA
jgi:hypothetical protein